MAVTIRSYNIPAFWTSREILAAIEQAMADTGLHGVEDLGIMLTFTVTASTIVAKQNERYLVSQSSCTSEGSGVVFDVVRSALGVPTFTIVNGGRNYKCWAIAGITTSNTVISGIDTTNLRAGMIVSKVSGTGTLGTTTVIASVDSPTQITLNKAPTVALSAATLLFADVLKVSAANLGGSSYTVSSTGTSGQTTLTVADTTNLRVNQFVSGTGVDSYCYITAISGTTVTLSVALTGNVSDNLTFEDAAYIFVNTIANQEGITGTATGTTITGVATSANVCLGAFVTVTSGSATLPAKTYVSSVTGTGPYTINLSNSFTGSGAVTVKISCGSTSTFYDIDITNPPVWAVAKVEVNPAKRLGHTYYSFAVSGVGLYMRSFPGFNPSANTIMGVAGWDYVAANTMGSTTAYNASITIASNNTFPLTLYTYQSGIDPNFVVFQFAENGVYRVPFVLSKYETAYQPWDLNELFLSSIWMINRNNASNTNDVNINFTSFVGITGRRAAEYGYCSGITATIAANLIWYYESVYGKRTAVTPTLTSSYGTIYLRHKVDWMQTSLPEYSPVIKGLPICNAMIPVPYYIPDDFVITEISPSNNLAYMDTITVSPSEIYKVIQFANHATSFAGMVFAARTT